MSNRRVGIFTNLSIFSWFFSSSVTIILWTSSSSLSTTSRASAPAFCAFFAFSSKWHPPLLTIRKKLADFPVLLKGIFISLHPSSGNPAFKSPRRLWPYGTVPKVAVVELIWVVLYSSFSQSGYHILISHLREKASKKTKKIEDFFIFCIILILCIRLI